jgi:hypothetical protein
VERYVALEPWVVEGFGDGHTALWIGLEKDEDEVKGWRGGSVSSTVVVFRNINHLPGRGLVPSEVPIRSDVSRYVL